MKRVLGILGSPRRMGNCELIVKEISSRFTEPAELSMVRLVDKDIRACKACYRCLTGDCPHRDDFGAILDAIASADGVVAAFLAARVVASRRPDDSMSPPTRHTHPGGRAREDQVTRLQPIGRRVRGLRNVVVDLRGEQQVGETTGDRADDGRDRDEEQESNAGHHAGLRGC